MASLSRFSLLSSIFAFLAAVTWATPSAPSLPGNCSSVIVNLADCLSYVLIGGSATKPEGTCCSGLKTVMETNVNCLCEAFKNSAHLGVKLNVTRAMTLPAACHISKPPVGDCDLSHVPSPAPAPETGVQPSPPALTPSPTPGEASSPAPAPAGGGSGSSPALANPMELLLKAYVMGAAISFALF